MTANSVERGKMPVKGWETRISPIPPKGRASITGERGLPKWTRGLPKKTSPLPKRTEPLPKKTRGLPKKTELSPKRTRGLPKRTEPLPNGKTRGLPRKTEPSPKRTRGPPQTDEGLPKGGSHTGRSGENRSSTPEGSPTGRPWRSTQACAARPPSWRATPMRSSDSIPCWPSSQRRQSAFGRQRMG
jgi:hypothetical protein